MTLMLRGLVTIFKPILQYFQRINIAPLVTLLTLRHYSELNKQVSIGRRDVVAEEARPINSISRVQAVVTAASKNSVQLKQVWLYIYI